MLVFFFIFYYYFLFLIFIKIIGKSTSTRCWYFIKSTWVSVNKKNYTHIFEIFYFFYFLLKFYNLNFFKNNYSNFYLLKKINQLYFNKLIYKNTNKYLNIKINFKFINLKELKISDEFSLKKIFFSNKNTNTYHNLLNLFFLFNYSLFNSYFKVHHNFNLFYVYSFSNKLILIDPVKFLIRWKESYDLIFNIFYYNFNPLVFSSNLFKNETLALNWNYNIFDVNVWRYYFPFFIFKISNFNRKTDFFFDKIYTRGINFFIITDCQYHFKNLHYINKKNFYSIGLVNVNLDPWIVTYPIVTFFENFLTQMFFFKILIFIERKVLLEKYVFFKRIWLNFLIKKFK